MKQMEYTIKVVVDRPLDPIWLQGQIEELRHGLKATVTSYRVLPQKKAAKS